MQDERPTTAELLEAWRETKRAAELAERLAALAADAATQADRNALAYESIAAMAEEESQAAERAASNAREAAAQARRHANESQEGRLRDADAAVVESRQQEAAAFARVDQGEADGDRPA